MMRTAHELGVTLDGLTLYGDCMAANVCPRKLDMKGKER